MSTDAVGFQMMPGCVMCCATLNAKADKDVPNSFGTAIREMRQAQALGLREAAERVGISPAYLSRIERSKEKPPKPEVIKRLAALLGGDVDVLFRLAESTDPDLAEYLHVVPNVPEFLRTAMHQRLTPDDFDVLIDLIKRGRPSEAIALGEE